MKKSVLLLMLILGLCLTSCHRNYKVIHARPAVDTLAHDDIDRVELPQEDDPIMDIPDIPDEIDVNNLDSKAQQEYDDFIHGR